MKNQLLIEVIFEMLSGKTGKEQHDIMSKVNIRLDAQWKSRTDDAKTHFEECERQWSDLQCGGLIEE